MHESNSTNEDYSKNNKYPLNRNDILSFIAIKQKSIKFTVQL